MKTFSGYLVVGEIGGKGTPYLYAPQYVYCIVEKLDGEYVFYVNGVEVLRTRYLRGRTWEIEYDSFGKINYTGYYWDFYSVAEWFRIHEQVLGENESIIDLLKEKYEGWGI
jgi:hypothetical protein